jgi:hypothetical protein
MCSQSISRVRVVLTVLMAWGVLRIASLGAAVLTCVQCLSVSDHSIVAVLATMDIVAAGATMQVVAV